MADIVVTVPRAQWTYWVGEGDLPGDPESGYESHFWIAQPAPWISRGSRVYVVAHGRLRGYAPLVRIERACQLNPSRACLVRRGGAVAVTLPESIRGFQGFRYRWWDREQEVPFEGWRVP